MKKILPLLVFVILFLSGFAAVAFPGEENCQQKSILSFSQLSINEDDDYVTLEPEGANSVLMKQDHYVVPTRIETFTFPFGTEITRVQCTPKNIHKMALAKELMVTPEPISLGQTATSNSNFKRYAKPVTTNSWCDYDVGAGIDEDKHCIFVKVQTFPVQYNPSENTIEWAETIEIDIQYKEPEQPIIFDDEYALVVIAPLEFSEELVDLLDHKNSRNLSTKLVTLDEIYSSSYFPVQGRDDPEKIKYFIKDAIENWNIRFVLLVGGAERFPGRRTHIYKEYTYQNEFTFLSDLYYADIYDEELNFSSWDTNENDVFGEHDWYGYNDQLDLYPDVYLGRLACVNEDEVLTCVNKIITYETEKAYTQNWFTNLVVIGGDSLPGDEEQIDEGEYVQENVIDIMEGFIPIKIWASNGKLNQASNINDAINNGAGFVFFNGHGSTDSWGTHPHENERVWIPPGLYRNSHVNALSNENKLPIVISDACHPCKYDLRSDCLGWTFVTNPNGGSIAFLGATDFDLSYGGVDIITKGIEKLCLELSTHYIEGIETFGELWGKSVSTYISPNMDKIDYITVEEFQPFGDPSLTIAGESLAPEKPDAPNGPTKTSVNKEHTYTACTTDPEEDNIYYLFDWDDGFDSGWIGPYASGEIAEASHVWTEQGNYEIRVKAKDEHGVQSDWSDPLPIIMPKNRATNFNSLFLRVLQNHPQMFPILRLIFGQ